MSSLARYNSMVGSGKERLATFPISFTKMQALGNDFVFVSSVDLATTPGGQALLREWHKHGAELARALCDRHYGIGADGLVLLIDRQRLREQSSASPALVNAVAAQSADLGWVYINSDGSPSDMCGNALRCLGAFAVNNKLVDGRQFTVATAAGSASVVFDSEKSITIDLGEPSIASDTIPLKATTQQKFIKQPIAFIAGKQTIEVQATCVSMGNPHCVIFDERYAKAAFADAELAQQAECLQNLPMFPEGVNVEFAVATKRDHIRVLVWERGCGATLACATGAAATLVAGVLEGLVERRCTIELPGGTLDADWSEADDHVRLTGPANQVFSGTVDLLHFPALRAILAREAICS
jgi:diaminopimelate epimerase